MPRPATRVTMLLTPEAALAAKLDIILTMDSGLQGVGGVEGFLGLPGLAQTPAGQSKRVVRSRTSCCWASGRASDRAWSTSHACSTPSCPSSRGGIGRRRWRARRHDPRARLQCLPTRLAAYH